MMSNNKILTVSYGTFSCTLEGFDDSFGTMKAIAEYFRDLAADDRYFGAEPPQPDAEMLTRIAQKEISRRVQAREHDGKIVLSALEDHSDAPEQPAAKTPEAAQPEASAPAAAGIAALAGAAAPAPQPAEAETAAEPAAPAPVEAAPAPVDEADAAIAAEAHVDLADLAREESAGTDSETPAEETAAPEPVSDLAEDAQASAAPETSVQDEDENDIVPGQPDSEVEAFFAENAAEGSVSDDFEDDVAEAAELAGTAEPVAAAPAAPAPDSIAAKLQRIRAVVAQQDDADDEEAYAEDEDAIAGSSAAAAFDDLEDAAEDGHADDNAEQDLVARARHDIEDALDADDAADQAETEDDYSDILNRLSMDEDDAVAEAVEDEAEGEDDRSSEVEDALANLFDDEDEAETEIEEVAEAEDAFDAIEDAEVEAALATEPETAPHPRARVIKVKRADLEAAINRGELEEYDDEEDDDFDMSDLDDVDPALDDLAPSKSADTSLSPEDEQELARELAELEKDIEGDNILPVGEKADDRAAGASRHTLPAIEDEASDDMSRLMAEADHHMDEPESTTRRNAFAHLRAAVAAKKADGGIGTDAEQEKKDRAFRSDLAEVVRPRRPVGSGNRTARPEESRPAPLKLVAEQRIDVEKTRAAGPVRPRRVSAVVTEPKATAEGTVSFAEYAEEMGAHSLPELLEAAAAYMSFVEGFEQFSRPQLMTKVRQVGPEEGFSREDGLRSFGQLLRAGKIEKIKGGRFTVSEDIGYRPDQRAVG